MLVIIVTILAFIILALQIAEKTLNAIYEHGEVVEAVVVKETIYHWYNPRHFIKTGILHSDNEEFRRYTYTYEYQDKHGKVHKGYLVDSTEHNIEETIEVHYWSLFPGLSVVKRLSLDNVNLCLWAIALVFIVLMYIMR